MGWNSATPEKFGLKVKFSFRVRVSGKCPMCETRFSVVTTEKSAPQNNDYECPCGYFTYYCFSPVNRMVYSDDHAVRKEEWQRRLHEKEK